MRNAKSLLVKTIISLLLVVVPLLGTVSSDVSFPFMTKASFASEPAEIWRGNLFIRYADSMTQTKNESESKYPSPSAIKEISLSSAAVTTLKTRLRQKVSGTETTQPVAFFCTRTSSSCKTGMMYLCNELFPDGNGQIQISKTRKLE